MNEVYSRYDMPSEICQNICECHIEHILTKIGMNTEIIIYSKCNLDIWRIMSGERPDIFLSAIL
jgi:hypothetical protein